MTAIQKTFAIKDSAKGDPPARALLFFAWEALVVAVLCGLFILFIDWVRRDTDMRSHYSLLLFHLIFPPLLFGVVTLATRTFRPGRMFLSTVLASVLLTAFFPFAKIAAALWVLAACLIVAYALQLRRTPRPVRGYRITGPRDPVDEDPELKSRMARRRQIDRTHGSQRRGSRPIPIGRFWPHSRL
jgi:hypothetical protein